MPMAISFPTKGNPNPFAEQLAFFKAKLNLPSERWDDIMKSAHDRAFIVAGATNADLLNDLHGAIAKAIEEGKGIDAFRKDFDRIVTQHGWVGWTGEGSEAGHAWRTRVIYQTNMATSYAAGRYKQLKHPDLLSIRPYWKYVHADGVMHPRPLHVSWHGLVLHHEHEFWDTHFPPNGWMCHCRVTPVDAKEYEKAKANGKGEPPAGWQEPSKKTGAPVGIDQGFDYAPGASTQKPLMDFVEKKLINLESSVGSHMWEVIRSAIEREQATAWATMVERVSATLQATGEARLAHVVESETIKSLAEAGVKLDNAAVWLRDDELLHALRDYKDARGASLPLDVWENLRTHLDDAIPYLDTVDQALIYVFDVPGGLGKMVVRVNYKEKARFDGVRDRITSNFIRTGSVVDPVNIENDARFVKLLK